LRQFSPQRVRQSQGQYLVSEVERGMGIRRGVGDEPFRPLGEIET
jgi:hypothetical protein